MNADVEFPDILNKYYGEGIECPKFSWAKCQRLEVDELAPKFEEEN